MTFPTLSTGAVVQYPSDGRVEHKTEVLRFLDGREQRFRRTGIGLRRWVIPLDLLTEEEMDTIGQFFSAAKGRQGSFSFRDPSDGLEYPSCSFETDEIELEFLAESRGRAVLTIKENL